MNITKRPSAIYAKRYGFALKRGRPAAKAAAPASPASHKEICFRDVAATAAHVALVCLAVFAVFGYFYTVMPVYQKELLAGRVAKQQEYIAALEEKNGALETRIRENAALLEQQQAGIAENQNLIAALQTEIQTLSQETAKITGENTAALQEKEDIEVEVGYLLEQAAATRKNLLTLERDLSQKYEGIFRESMEDYAVKQFLALYRKGKGPDVKNNVDIIVEYKERTVPVADIIEKSLSGYGQKLSKSYAMIPAPVRKRLAEEGKTSLAKREDLKTVPFDSVKVIALINERDNKIFALPANLSRSERTKQIAQISREYARKLTDLVAEFKHDYIRQVRDFFES
ncbi:MAG: hypothetical protein DELT_00764 [Desulfovibrio sp.]